MDDNYESERLDASPTPASPLARDGRPMRLIALKFPGTCRSCRSGLSVGVSAWWAKGEPPVCVECAAGGETEEAVSSPEAASDASQASDSVGSDAHVPSGLDGRPMRLIALKFPSACRVCKKGLDAGASAWWAKGETPLCPDCGTHETTSGVVDASVETSDGQQESAGGHRRSGDVKAPLDRSGRPMRLISLKFSGACPTCSTDLGEGTSVYWSKGEVAICVDCAWQGRRAPRSPAGDPLYLRWNRGENDACSACRAEIPHGQHGWYDSHYYWGLCELCYHAGVELESRFGLDVFLRSTGSNEGDLGDILAIARDPDASVRRVVAQRSTLSEVLETLVSDPESSVRYRVAENASVSPEALLKLADDEDDEIRWAVACNASASPEALLKLGDVEADEIRWAVACNASSPVGLLKRLATDQYWGVRCGVAANENTPDAVMKILASDKIANVRESVAGNASLSVSALRRLAFDEVREVRAAVVRSVQGCSTPAKLESLAGTQNVAVRAAVARNPCTPLHVLVLLAEDKDFAVRAAVAGNRETPHDLLQKLAVDKSKAVRGRVADNPKAPPRLLLMLATDENEDVRAAAAGNPRSPVDALTKLALDVDPRVRTLVKQHPKATEEMKATVALLE